VSDLLNKYTEAYTRLIDAMVEYHNYHSKMIRAPNSYLTRNTRRALRNIRQAAKDLSDIAGDRSVEYKKEKEFNKGKNNE